MYLVRVGLVCDVQAVSLGAKWTRAENSRDSSEVQKRFWLGFLTEPLGSTIGHLEDASPLALVEYFLPDLLIIKVNRIRMEMSIIIIPDLLEGWLLDVLVAFEDVADGSRNHTESR